MATTNEYGLEAQVAKAVDRIRPMIARQKAALLGPAPGAVDVRGQEELRMWNEKQADIDILTEKAQLIAQGLTPAQAEAKATLIAYPNRGRMLLSAGGSDPAKQSQYAEHMDRASKKQDEYQQPAPMPGAEEARPNVPRLSAY